MNSYQNPYPGIRPFDTDDSQFFFGRDQQIAELRRKLTSVNFVAVVGESGSGKSSLVRAGLIPSLLKSGWKVALFRPENNPIENLINAVNSDDVLGLYIDKDYTRINLEFSSKGIIETYKSSCYAGNLLIVVDQFEELFRFTSANRDEAVRFMNLIISAVNDNSSDVSVILIFRSNFLGRCSQFKGLPELINEGQFLIPRLTRQQYKEAILGPLQAQNVSMSPTLISRLLNDIGNDPDQLPVLQHALMMTFDLWKLKATTEPIDVDSYDEIGGMSAALNLHCNKIFDALAKHGLGDLTVRIFQKLTDTLQGELIRRPCPISELNSIATGMEDHVKDIVHTYRFSGKNFLMPNEKTILTDDTMIDLSHECIMRKWEMLRKWIAEEKRHEEKIKKLAQYFQLLTSKQTLPQSRLVEYVEWQKFKEYRRDHYVRRDTINWSRRYTPEFESYTGLIFRSLNKSALKQNLMWITISVIALVGIAIAVISFRKKELEKVQVLSELSKKDISLDSLQRSDSILFAKYSNGKKQLEDSLKVLMAYLNAADGDRKAKVKTKRDKDSLAHLVIRLDKENYQVKQDLINLHAENRRSEADRLEKELILYSNIRFLKDTLLLEVLRRNPEFVSKVKLEYDKWSSRGLSAGKKKYVESYLLGIDTVTIK